VQAAELRLALLVGFVTDTLARLVGGNAPYIVNRHTGEVRVTSTAHPIEHYVDDNERELSRG
jgi:hypothetical protein